MSRKSVIAVVVAFVVLFAGGALLGLSRYQTEAGESTATTESVEALAPEPLAEQSPEVTVSPDSAAVTNDANSDPGDSPQADAQSGVAAGSAASWDPVTYCDSFVEAGLAYYECTFNQGDEWLAVSDVNTLGLCTVAEEGFSSNANRVSLDDWTTYYYQWFDLSVATQNRLRNDVNEITFWECPEGS